MRPIKFRGETFDGKVVYGDLLQFEGKTAICTSVYTLVFYAATKKGLQGVVNVKPESVVQLVGYDADGNEIYEGDNVWGVGRFVYPAEISFDIDDSARYQIGDKIPNRLDSTRVE